MYLCIYLSIFLSISRYFFAAAITAETGKVLSYGVACNSCAFCNGRDNKLRESVISREEYELKMSFHNPFCSAEYAELSSVQFESAIDPIVIEAALRRGVVFFAIVSDGDNKTTTFLQRQKCTRIYATLLPSSVSSASLTCQTFEDKPP